MTMPQHPLRPQTPRERRTAARESYAATPPDISDRLAGDLTPSSTDKSGNANGSSEEATHSRLKLLDILEYSTDINRHRYDLYMWCESKIYSLITVDSLLFGALFLVVGSRVPIRTDTEKALFSLTIAALALSLVVSLWHINPKMDSKVGNKDNPRSSIGIEHSTPDEYLETLMKLDIESMIRFNSKQIKGMNKIIMTNERAIKLAATSTIVGLLTFISLMAQGSFK